MGIQLSIENEDLTIILEKANYIPEGYKVTNISRTTSVIGKLRLNLERK